MLFNSYIFVLFFLPLCILGYYLINYFHLFKTGQLFLLGMSLWFYGYFNPSYLFIILGSVLGNYVFFVFIQKTSCTWLRKAFMTAGVICNVGLLVYFKYMDFFIENINTLFKTDYNLLNIVLPLGISFFTFQQVSFIVDSYRGGVPPYNILDYACFVTFFPQLVAGPIVTHNELVPQFMDASRKKVNWENLSRGLYIFVYGLAKKVLLADVFGKVVSIGYANLDAIDATNAFLTMFAYTFQIYFDFSGYCDMAIGIGKMLNIDLPINFNSPYKALTITEFWARWHMTLTRFLTKYIYIPLGGNRKGEKRTYLNILIVFLVSGFWHGANWTFVLWGFFHGLFSVLTRKFNKFFETLHPALNWLITFGFVNVTWVFFRADSIGEAVRLLNRIAIANFGPINSEIVACFDLREITLFTSRIPNIGNIYPCYMLIIFYVLALLIILGSRNAYERMQTFKPTLLNSVVTACLLVWCVLSFEGVSTFLYFNF